MNKCKCCEKLTINQYNEYDICEICGWEDDKIQSDDPDFSGGANKLSLNEFKKQWQASMKK